MPIVDSLYTQDASGNTVDTVSTETVQLSVPTGRATTIYIYIYIYTYIDLNFSDSLPSFRIPVFATFTVIVPMLQACPPAQDLSIHNTFVQIMLSDPVFYIRGSLFARLGGSRFPQGLQRWNPFEMKYTHRASRVSQNETFHSIFVPDATRGHVCIFQHGISTAAVCQS